MSNKKTVLFVDDESSVLNTLKRLFRHEKYHVFTAISGTEGLKILDEMAVDLVISDQRMPHMNGVEFLQQVREKHPATARMIMSGYADIEAVINAVNMGSICHFLTKPWDNDELKQIVCDYFINVFRSTAKIDEQNKISQQLHLTVFEQKVEIDFLKDQLNHQ
ncbi:MAG: response regulator [Pseudomonadales bacterium]